jgi:phospholipid/cholesterol/gamma-HCH transport system substrate-binding protein
MSLPEDERARYRIIHHGEHRRVPSAVIGLLFLIVATVGPYLAFREHLPFVSRGYELQATFKDSLNLQARSPVRIAGVDVGQVTGTEANGDLTAVTFTVEDEGRPVHADASVKLRPRMFFEGNYFLDLEPGSPSEPEMESGENIPVSRTASTVQLDEILTSLQRPIRDDLGELLYGWGTTLTREPTPADDRTFETSVRGLSAAAALNKAFGPGARAGRSSAEVGEALRGARPRDLRRMIAAAGRTADAFAAERGELQELISNWAAFTGALADESENLGATFRELAPTLETTDRSFVSLNRMLPPLRTWARLIRPGVAELPATIDAAGPWLTQARPLVSPSEAGGTARLLREAVPGLSEAARSGLNTLTQIRLLSRCTSDVLVPTGDQVIADRFSTGEPNHREFFYAAANIAGESQSFSGNGPFVQTMASGGELLAGAANPTGQSGTLRDDLTLCAPVVSPPLGTQPQLGGLPPKRPDVRCHANDVPDLNAGHGQPGPPMPAVGYTP